MYKFSRREYFTLHSGLYEVKEGIIIKQKPLPNGNYSNVAVLSNGYYYNSLRDSFDYVRLFVLEDCIISRAKEVNDTQLLKQYTDIEELNYIQTFPQEFTRQKIYLFIQWAEKQGIMHLLTQDMVAGFCGVGRVTVARHDSEMRELGLICL